MEDRNTHTFTIPDGMNKEQLADLMKDIAEKMKTAPEAPKDNDIFIWAIIDRSGSMSPLIDDTINGFNHFISEQSKLEDGEAYLTTLLFDNEHLIINDKQHIKSVKPLTTETYVPRGSTSLYDAIGRTLISAKSNNRKNNIVLILTDGFENSSHEFKHHDIKKMIAEAEENGWKFIYLGANQDAFAVSQGLGIVRGASVNFSADSLGVKTAYNTMSSFTASARASYVTTTDTETDKQ